MRPVAVVVPGGHDGQKFTKRVSLVNSAFVLKMSPKVGKYTVAATYTPASGQMDFMGSKRPRG